ncbi:imm11 family protein [Cellvibrio sp. PSBB006]|uniref:imm11 family protein n=1 Tax=Cellvibrio sp. PSBB006 TaxID=1987723 RepID=UPI000B3BA0CA|nr:DUF1629 domain-containing protein [Cellvibrio sp. PSBB006]ARU26089.1 hypothetical protein CBR65_00810 [Cellvibrio sp. PSBB006]
MYFWIREDWRRSDTVIGTPDIGDDEIDFLLGVPILKNFKMPVEFETTYQSGDSPHQYFDYGTCIPAVGEMFLKALQKAGVDNFQAFPAILKNFAEGSVWENYYALNVIGMVNATDLDNSHYDEIMGGNDEGMPALGSFTVLALKEEKLHSFDMFREPIGGNLIFSERLWNVLDVFSPPGGYGIIAHEVILT